MITAGLKLTGSGGIALIRDDKLEFDIGGVPDLKMIPASLAAWRFDVHDVDEWAAGPDPGRRGNDDPAGTVKHYTSHSKVASRLAAAYCTSPFAARGEPSSVLVWNGDSFPELFHVDAAGRAEPGGALFPLIGDVYAMAAERFGLASADDLMASVALGTVKDEIIAVLRDVFAGHFPAATPERVAACLDAVQVRMDRLGVDVADVRTSLHAFLQELLTEELAQVVREPVNLCFTGGCALNVMWATALRDLPVVKQIWVPPFPDGSGAAIGAAAAHLGAERGLRPLDWDVRSGPALTRRPHVPEGWSVSPCRPEELARMMRLTGRPAVVLNGRAALGPRALTARAILAPATDAATRGLLNRAARRAAHQPVGALCLDGQAGEVFEPGGPDPYMMFEHRVRPEWMARIPAVPHADGTARVQTVAAGDDPVISALLREYHKWSGVPVLCGVPAPFRDAADAMERGPIDIVWSDGVLHRRVRESGGAR